MSVTTEPKADAPRGQGRIEAALDAFDAAETEQAPAAERQPAPNERPAAPEPPPDGAPTPPRDERGRFTSQQDRETPAPPRQAPPAQEPPAPAEQPPPEQPVDKAAQLEARLAELERSYSSNVNQLRTQNQQLQQQLQQGEQTWRQQQEQRVAAERDRLRRDLDLRIARSPEATAEQIQEARDLLEGRFATEDLARERAERQAEREGWQQFVGASQRQQVLTQLPAALGEYAPHMAGLARAQHDGVTEEEARAFLAEPPIQQAIRETLPLGREAVNTLSSQLAYVLGQRSRLAAQERAAAAQQQLLANRTAAAGNGATRELVPGAAGEPAPDYSKYRNSGDIAGALDAYEEDRQAGRAR